MNKQADIKAFGIAIFFISMVVFAIYCLYIYIPALTSDMTNADVVMNAVWWGLGCGVVGTIGLILARL